jgi:UDPglucose--hexose-1-phosphate uridylyltransferase
MGWESQSLRPWHDGFNMNPPATGAGILVAMPSLAATPRPPLLHHDARTGRAVFVAPGRDERPTDAELAAGCGVADAAGWCPFCAGNESLTPPDVVRAPADTSAAWQARIIPNRYPFVAAANPANDSGTPRPAHGVHEVVIESPRHDTLVTAIDPAGWRASWALVQGRLAELARRDDLAWGTVFKNSGPRAGASLEHVHSQLVAVDFVPPAVAAEFAAAARQADPFATLLAEAAAERRIVTEADGLVALAPAAQRQPGEIWVVPADREPHFHGVPPSRAAALADLTRDLVGRLARILPGADFNWWLHEAAWRATAAPLATDRWHWHLEIVPRVNQLAGFELGTGCHITPLPAVEAAARLRDA